MGTFSIWHWLIALPIIGFLLVLFVSGIVLLVKAIWKGKQSGKTAVDDSER